MPVCEVNSDGVTNVVLLFCFVSLRAVIALVSGSVFAFKWFTQLDSEFRSKRIPRLIAGIVLVLSVESFLRLLELRMWYLGPRLAVSMLYQINSALLGLFFGLLFWLLLSKLERSFQNSSYAVSKSEMRVLYGLVSVEVTGIFAQMVLSDLSVIRSSDSGVAAMFLLTVILTVLGLIILGRVDLDFANRLKILVATSVASEREAASQREFYDNDSPHRHQSMPTFSNFHNSTLSSFSVSEQQLLIASIRGSVSALWVSVSFVIYGLGGSVLVLAKCANWAYLMAHLLTTLAYPIVTLSLSFTLPNASFEYRICCSCCNQLVRKLMAWLTEQHAMEIVRQKTATLGSVPELNVH